MCISLCLKDTAPPILFPLLIVFLGLVVGATVLGLDIPHQMQAQAERFYKVADESFIRFESSLDDYKVSGMWLHQACNHKNMTFEEFRGVYQHITWTGLEFQGVACGFNVTTWSQRAFYEDQSSAYLGKYYPTPAYPGFNGAIMNPISGEVEFGPLPNASSYFVTHFAEPLEDYYNLVAIDYDMSTSPHQLEIVMQALETGNLSVTERLRYQPPPKDVSDVYQYSLILVHPGLPLQNETRSLENHAAVLVIRFVALLYKAYKQFSADEQLVVYVYDSTASVIGQEGQPAFLGGAALGSSSLTEIPELNYTDLQQVKVNHRVDYVLNIAERQWRYVAVAPIGTYEPEYFIIIFGALMIIIASSCIALWMHSRYKAKTEKSTILLESAERAARVERELNDFIAHEVRNPLSAAMSANSFVSVVANEAKPLLTTASIKSVREDVKVIGNSLQYINDLLRSMLDSHCLQSQQITTQLKPVDILNDVFNPVASMLYRRGCGFDVVIDCPEELVVRSDALRLKQVLLNLALNSAKFVNKGFVRMGAYVKEGAVYLHVDDSGPGIPVEKRHHLFAKFQPSLDTLHQGTGVGLSLCKQLVELMGGEITLDETYTSGVSGCPGTRFIISLKATPIAWESSQELNDDDEPSLNTEKESCTDFDFNDSFNQSSTQLDLASGTQEENPLPQNLSVLFVDDDFILRKLFVRSIKRCRPKWVVNEAASGEAALQLIEERGSDSMFDVIFMDQYMASTQKQLLGTETLRLLRSNGVTSIVCGLSANNLQTQFLEAGADCFIVKPLPCETRELAKTLQWILQSNSAMRHPLKCV